MKGRHGDGETRRWWRWVLHCESTLVAGVGLTVMIMGVAGAGMWVVWVVMVGLVKLLGLLVLAL